VTVIYVTWAVNRNARERAAVRMVVGVFVVIARARRHARTASASAYNVFPIVRRLFAGMMGVVEVAADVPKVKAVRKDNVSMGHV
jgi:hypothetical protein